MEYPMINDLNDYQEAMRRFVKPLEGLEENLAHAYMGLLTEVGELVDALKKHLIYERPLDRENLAEECGDIMWYAALYLNTIGESMDELLASIEKSEALESEEGKEPVPFSLNRAPKYLGDALGEIASSKGSLELGFMILMYTLRELAKQCDKTLLDIARTNIAKLTLRYPDGYTNAAATARADKDE
jgi:NTP pyrophosphatase (non-canonical NTP hydrolase)